MVSMGVHFGSINKTKNMIVRSRFDWCSFVRCSRRAKQAMNCGCFFWGLNVHLASRLKSVVEAAWNKWHIPLIAGPPLRQFTFAILPELFAPAVLGSRFFCVVSPRTDHGVISGRNRFCESHHAVHGPGIRWDSHKHRETPMWNRPCPNYCKLCFRGGWHHGGVV